MNDVRLTGYGRAIAVLAGTFAIGAFVSAILISIAAARRADGGDRLRAHADVVDVDTVRGEHPRRVVTYRFDAGDRTVRGRSSLRERDARDIAPGGRIPVEYVARDPDRNWIAGHEPGGIPLALIPAISGVLLVVAGLLAWQVRRQWVLLSEGRQATARVTGYKKVHRDKHTAYEVSATFQDLSGATRSMKYEVRKAPPAAGTTVTIVYHRDNPRWNAVYPLRFVRPIRDAVSGSDRSARMESRRTAAVPPG